MPASAIAVDGTTVVWTDGTSIHPRRDLDDGDRSVPKSGGPVTVVVQIAMGASHLALDEENVYWTAGISPGPDTGLFKAKRSGGIPARLAAGHTPGGVVAAVSAVFWTDYNYYFGDAPSGSGIHRLDPDGTDRVLAEGAPRELVVDGANIYATSHGVPWATRVPIAGGQGGITFSSTLLPESYPDSQAIALAQDELFFSVVGKNGAAAVGAIVRAPKSAGPSMRCMEYL